MIGRRLAIACSICVTAVSLIAQAPSSLAIDSPFFTGITDVASLRTVVHGHLTRADDLLAALLAVKGVRTSANTLVPYDRMWNELSSGRELANVVESLHPDESMRDAASELGRTLAANMASLSLRPDLHAVVTAAASLRLDPVARHLVQRELRDFRLSGADKSEATRTRVARLRDELEAAIQAFDRNLRNGQRTILVAPADLDGLPADFIATHTPDGSGRVRLTTDAVDMQPVLRYARSEELRRRLFIERSLVATPANLDVLARIVSLRADIARELGFINWADYHAQTRMAGSAAGVAMFIDRVAGAARPRATREYGELLKRKQQDAPAAAVLNEWDRAYYTDLLRRAAYNLDSQEVRAYFPYERVRAGVMDASARLFDVTFRPAPQLPAWHPDVERFEVVRNGAVIARIYLDVHPRAQKLNSGAGVSPVRAGIGGTQVPEAVLAASVPGGRAGDPGLMTHDQVRTLFHEFGHIMHAVVGGQGPFSRLNGIALEPDTAEAPSTMFEEWIWDPKTLSTFARHYLTGEPIAAALVARLRGAGEFGKGMDAARQAFLARVSLSLYDRSGRGIDPAAVVRDLLAQESPMKWGEPTLVAQFTHLANPFYTSSYYTYLWSGVIAKDLFSRFDSSDLLATGVAHRYRDTVLVPGGSKPAPALFQEFLGRPFNFDAYAAWLNRETVTP